jgi:hypothetical protein
MGSDRNVERCKDRTKYENWNGSRRGLKYEGQSERRKEGRKEKKTKKERREVLT